MKISFYAGLLYLVCSVAFAEITEPSSRIDNSNSKATAMEQLSTVKGLYSVFIVKDDKVIIKFRYCVLIYNNHGGTR